MKMMLNTLHRTFCVNNRTVMKSLSVTSVTEVRKISTYKKCYSTSYTVPEYNQFIAVDKLDIQNLYNFRKSRNYLMETGNYDHTSTRKLNISEFLHPETIQSIRQMDWSYLTSSEILRNFRLLSINAFQTTNEEITDEVYRAIVSVVTAKCWKFSDHELHTLLKYLELWSSIEKVRNPNNPARKLFEQIDKEFDKRSRNWTVDKTLMYCDTVCRVFSFHSSFVSNSLNRITMNPSTLSHTNIVQIMYYLFVYGIPKSRVMQLEPYIEDHFDKFKAEELGIICLGYFRTQVHITSDTLLCKLMQKVIDDVDSITSNEMGAFFKAIRYSFLSKPHCVQKCEELLEKLVPRVPHMAEPVLTHLSHLVADSQICNPRLLTAIIERFSESLEKMRLKDFERIIFLMTSFNIPPTEPLYDLIVKELGSPRRKHEIRNFPREFGFALRHLAVANIYPLHLISTFLSREHVNLAYGPNPHDLGVEYLILDQSIEIEVPLYNGPRIESTICNILAKKYNNVAASRSFGNQSKQRIVEILNKILPHFSQTDIILCLDEDNNTIPPKPILRDINSHIKRVPEEFKNRKWIAIIFATETLLIRGTNQFTGNLCAKIRQLKKVGYVPIVVPYVEWKILYTDLKKYEYLRQKILDSTHTQTEKKNCVEKPVKKSCAL
ncbi:FAST kinase domain-containing protein 5, mitochondrial-like isoform X2 [Belonocnema kinseyi]|uniref:FAST kinase domain-containing protein 5, mitochondrial-like isoform X2 n=1 Tax=Belonocnema kinseyi TaxID=2817044 RepID=UPI00143E0A7A|nr:FAST kinase domain-containing protein 5, mitochondrial-like isoform X2 [Belonocnema kinseyi]